MVIYFIVIYIFIDRHIHKVYYHIQVYIREILSYIVNTSHFEIQHRLSIYEYLDSKIS